MAESSTAPPQPRAPFSAESHSSSSRGPRPSCSTTVTSLPPRPLRSRRTTARAGPFRTGGGFFSGPRGRSPSLPLSAPNGLWKGFFSSSGGIAASGNDPARGEEGVGTFAVRVRAEETVGSFARRFANELRMIALEAQGDLLVLLGADGAGRVDNPSAGPHRGQGLFEDFALEA